MGVELIAEVSSNHGGSVSLAKDFIWHFAAAGADWIKFQSYQVQTLRPDDPQREWLAKAELSDEAHHELKAECERAGVKFLTTVFHASRVPFLQSLGLEAIKIGSGEAREIGLRNAVLATGMRAIVSCGMGTNWCVCQADLLRCVTRYPCPAACADAYYGAEYAGWSDHSIGLEGCRIALCNGARIIEKHVQIASHQARPARAFEATVTEFKALREYADEWPEQLIGRWQHA